MSEIRITPGVIPNMDDELTRLMQRQMQRFNEAMLAQAERDEWYACQFVRWTMGLWPESELRRLAIGVAKAMT